MADASKVIHIRNVPGDTTEEDLHLLAQQFAPVAKVVNIRSKNQALIQMADVQHAMALVQYYTEVQPMIRGQKVYLQFSSHQELTSTDNAPRGRQGDMDQQPNRILLVTIHNPLYPIDVNVLQQVFSPHGFVEKIVTFTKAAGLQALLQYSNQQSAVQARNTLQGRNIYDGCCTLDIQFSNLQELQVHFNNDRTRDFTNNMLPENANARPALGGQPFAPVTSLFGDGGNVFGMHHHPAAPPRPGPFQQQPGQIASPGLNTYQVPLNPGGMAQMGGSPMQGQPGMGGPGGDRCTILVSNLAIDQQQMDPDKLFNLFSNYGNIGRIKMLHNKPDHALIEMADPYQAEMAVSFLKGASVFGKRLEVNFSKHSHINPSPDTREFSTSPLNRFTRNAAKGYRHCTAPTRMLHVSSLPQDITSEALTEAFAPYGTILGAKVFDKDGKKQALVLFQSPEEATMALVVKHATPMGTSSSMRIAFSKNNTL
eukprot:TRINITY_DN35583_c0_g1_i1.p1 TRINITY_DN35583_c0_g1~~TRINITY_DN35583_c0_g1_i1.p1  ORF type:complete len:520 (-),score=99.15 TRINITY_DN35583_c0_g1_i1:640-2085(-)